MQVIRYRDLKPARWANGGGVTRQLAVGQGGPAAASSAPAASGAPDWDWRISIAEVEQAGPFSALPGIDRVLTVIDGDLILLDVDGAEHPLERNRPFRFSGDSRTGATLPTGAVMDLNVMTRRGAFRGYTAIVELSRKRPHPVFAGQHAVLLQGEATVTEPDGGEPAADAVALARFDAVVGSGAAPEITGRGFLAVVSVDPVEG